MTVSAWRARPALTCALAWLAACRPGATPVAKGGDDAAAMHEVVRRYEAASNDGNADSLAALYADDALLLPPDGGVVSGHDAIQAFWQDGIEPGISFEVVQSGTAANQGFVAGRFLVEATDSAPADSGKYVLCLRRQTDGAWRVVADIWNSTPSPDETDDEQNADPRTHVTSAVDRHGASERVAMALLDAQLHRASTYVRRAPRPSSRRTMRR